MKLLVCSAAALASAISLTSCGSGGSGQGSGTGPFDSRGNYVEAWADNPAKWRKPGGSAPASQPDEVVPEITKIEQPPMDSSPLAASASRNVSSDATAPEGDSLTPAIVKVKPETQASIRPKSPPEREVASRPKVKPKEVSKPREVSRPKVVSKPKEISKPKPKVKPTPAPKRYLVRAGDSLSAIASRNGVSVSSLQRANGIKGSNIRPGQSLTIPK